jgi:NADH-quinone oxidoreductase subunit G
VGTQGLQRITDVPINFADPMARRAPALQQTADSVAPKARICADTLAKLGLNAGDALRLGQGNGEAHLIAQLDNTVPADCVRVAAAHLSTAALGDMFGQISVERA